MTDLQGSSVILYSNKKFIHHQYYVATEWTGGLFVSPTLAGSRFLCLNIMTKENLTEGETICPANANAGQDSCLLLLTELCMLSILI